MAMFRRMICASSCPHCIDDSSELRKTRVTLSQDASIALNFSTKLGRRRQADFSVRIGCRPVELSSVSRSTVRYERSIL